MLKVKQSKKLTAVAWSQSQPCLRGRAEYSLDKSPARRRALTDEQCGVQYLAQGDTAAPDRKRFRLNHSFNSFRSSVKDLWGSVGRNGI